MVNFKVYQEVEGQKAVHLAKVCQKVADESNVDIAICPPMLSLAMIARMSDIPVYSQNVDPLKPGSGTGFVTPSMLHCTDVAGTLVNHSEHKRPLPEIAKCVQMCDDLGLWTCVCADTVDIARQVAAFRPTMVAVEPPELIGGDISVTTANPAVVEDTVRAVAEVSPGTAVLCGAGVKNGKDVRAALDLGASGVLLASGVVKAKDPEAVLRDLIKYL